MALYGGASGHRPAVRHAPKDFVSTAPGDREQKRSIFAHTQQASNQDRWGETLVLPTSRHRWISRNGKIPDDLKEYRGRMVHVALSTLAPSSMGSQPESEPGRPCIAFFTELGVVSPPPSPLPPLPPPPLRPPRFPASHRICASFPGQVQVQLQACG